MNKRNLANTIVKESITDALIKLMKKKQFNDITISELTETAGVGRVSFYRNYESKEDVLLTYILGISSAYWETHHKENTETLWTMTFDIFEILKPTFQLIHRSGITSILYEFLLRSTKPDDAQTKEEAYVRSMYTGLVYGILYHWLNTGMKESKDELVAIFHNMVLPYTIQEKTK